METNGKKSISESIKEAEKKGLTVVIVGAGSEEGSHARLHKFVSENPDKFMMIPFEDLTDEDKAKLEQADKNKPNPAFEKPPIPFKNYAPEPLPNIELTADNYKTKHFAGFPNKKLKGYQKGKKR